MAPHSGFECLTWSWILNRTSESTNSFAFGLTVGDSKDERGVQGSLDLYVGNYVKCLRHSGRMSEEWGRTVPMSTTPPPHSSLTGLLFSWRERWLHLVSPFAPLIFLVLLAFTSAEKNEQTAAFAETVLFLFCLQLACSAPSNPTLPTVLLRSGMGQV